MRKPVSFAVAALLVGASLGPALVPASAAAMSLDEALAATYVGNPELQAARASLRATDEQVPQALAGWRPTVTVSGSYGRQISEQNTSTAIDREIGTNPKNMTFTVSQPLFRGFRTVNATDGAENTIKAARGSLTATEQTVLLSAVSAYMDVLRDMSVLELNVNNEQVLRRQLDATTDRFEVGEITRTDVSQAEARYAGSVASRIAAESNLQTTRATFEQIVGVPPENLQWPSDVTGLPTTLEDTVQLAESQQPSLVAAEYTARAAVDNVREVRGELLPTVSLEASSTQNWEASNHDSYNNVQSVVATVSVPLYQAGSVYSRLRAAKSTAGQRRLEVDLAQQQVRASGVQSWESLQSARAQIDSLTSQVDSSRIALEGVQREAQVGSRTVLDVLDAEQELLDAQVNLVLARRNERVASFQLLSAVGMLTAEGLGLPVDACQTNTHYDDVRDQWFGGDDASAASYDDATDPQRARLVKQP
jgi:outer membrane protein